MESKYNISEVQSHLVEYLEGKGIDTRKQFRCLNPEHNDSNPSMSLVKGGKRVYCFGHGCNARYDLIDLVGIDYGLTDFKDKLEKAAQLFHVLPTGGEADKKQNRGDKNYLALYRRCNADLSKTDYYTQRGISRAVADKFLLGYKEGYYLDSEGRTMNALIIPTSAKTFVARNTDSNAEKKDRYRKVGERTLFNSKALENNPKTVFVVEGEIDCLSIIECGYIGVGLGSANNVEILLERITDIKQRKGIYYPIGICLDDDKAGEEAAQELKAGLDKLGIKNQIVDIRAGYNDPNEALVKDREGFEKALEGAADSLNKSMFDLPSNGDLLQDFVNDIAESSKTPPIKTGFPCLDNKLGGGLFADLIVLGAMSSLGKTTLCLQMADNIAKSGTHILFFTLEMARNVLMAKSIARISYILAQKEGYTVNDSVNARQVLNGSDYLGYTLQRQGLIKAAMEYYGDFADNIHMIEGDNNLSVRGIRQLVGKFKQAYQSTPVVIVDYLQLLPPLDNKYSDPQMIVDQNISELYRICRDFNCPVIVISSVGRQNYNKTIGLDCYKQSGRIEYTADICLGLQYEGTGRENFDIEAAKKTDKRQVELVLLKNRLGEIGAKIPFTYRVNYDYFLEEFAKG